MLKNISKNKIIVKEIKICNSIFSKALGLMFSKKNNNLGLIFIFDKEKLVPLHMFFVFYPIDVIYLNRDKKVVEIKRNFKPWKYYNSKKKAKYVIELVTGKAKEIKLNDKISW
jgi:uncharacterized protein